MLYVNFPNRLSPTLVAAVCLTAALLVFAPGPLCAETEPKISALSAAVVDAATGRTIFEKNQDLKIAPASLTKIMTLYLCFSALERKEAAPDSLISVRQKLALPGGASMGLKPGMALSLARLMEGAAVGSANDACMVLAETLGSGVSKFVDKMNAKAAELGMNSSKFMNPHGLAAKGQVVTVRDMLVLARSYIRSFPQALELHSLKSRVIGKTVLINRNRLLGKYPGLDGLKTGRIRDSGYCLAATAKRGQTRLISLVMGCASKKARDRDSAALLDYGFAMTKGEK